MEDENYFDVNCSWDARYSNLRIDKGIEGCRNKRTSGDYQNYSPE